MFEPPQLLQSENGNAASTLVQVHMGGSEKMTVDFLWAEVDQPVGSGHSNYGKKRSLGGTVVDLGYSNDLRVNYGLSTTSSTNLLQRKATMKNLKERKKEAFLNEMPTVNDSIRLSVLEAFSFPADILQTSSTQQIIKWFINNPM
ncbi:hypothetical protein WN944_026964 [Citrus x changshan-huyou]|uniref:Uncharacterized protein n=1 Tax=Citrus x changshan-huyou TaxID=2935761 RepID=A0AAP0LHK8_9ROSI